MRILKRNKKLIVDDKEITDQANILEYIRELYKFVLTKPEKKTLSEIKSILSHINNQKLFEDKDTLWERFKQKIFIDSLKRRQNDI